MAAQVAEPKKQGRIRAGRGVRDMSPAIETHGLTKSYGSLMAVDHLD